MPPKAASVLRGAEKEDGGMGEEQPCHPRSRHPGRLTEGRMSRSSGTRVTGHLSWRQLSRPGGEAAGTHSVFILSVSVFKHLLKRTGLVTAWDAEGDTDHKT